MGVLIPASELFHVKKERDKVDKSVKSGKNGSYRKSLRLQQLNKRIHEQIDELRKGIKND